jgi:uncharacterized membrane protein
MADTVTHGNGREMNEKPLFSALLVPHRSLSKAGFTILLAVFAVICLSSAIFYYALGAWPVVWFLLADIAIFWFAFRLNYRSGRETEEVELTRSALIVRKYTPGGKRREHTYNPFWVRFQIKRDEARGIIDMRIVGEGYQSTLGAFLNPDDKESFASAFGEALATAKR